MFLIEWEENAFIDGERVDYLYVKKNEVVFTMAGDNEATFRVQGKYADVFINNMQALNDNITSIESRFHELSKE